MKIKIPEGQYEFTQYEPEIKNFWLENKFYKPEYNPKTKKVESTDEMKKDPRQPFSIILPPPNAYGRPHMGNLSGNAYQDAMGRFARMNNKKVLLLPGKDHAGLEGEGVFVRDVLEKEGINKFDLSREDFYQRIWDFNMQNKALALQDEQTLGLSADFDRDIFTLDERVVNTVLSTFVEMYNQNMIYKGVRIVNWDPKARSVIADNQCERKEKDGFLYYIKYPLARKKTWHLNFRYDESYNLVKDGKKKIETRALNPEEPDRYFGDIKAGDTLIFVDKTESKRSSLYKKAKAVHIFTSLEEAYEQLSWTNVFDKRIDDIIELEQGYASLSLGYADKIRKNGLVAIELEDLEENDYLTVATTRPETILGDTALVVNPTDERYSNLVGKNAIVPLVDRVIPIITDPMIEKEFGTGVLKLTPAHSADDYAIMERWNSLVDKEKHDNSILVDQEPEKKKVTYLNIINKDLKLTGPAGKYVGIKINAGKLQVIEDLKAAGLLTKEEGIKQNILVSERTGATIEPIMSSQWFMDIDKIRQPVIDMVRNGEVKIYPKSRERKFYHWMENLRDWAISRSLWWGYRLPVWYHGEIIEKVDDNGQIALLIDINGEEVDLDPANPDHLKVQIEKPKGEGWIQDPDVLDTWFSSGQWPYATLQAYGLMDTFYPTDVLETADDILENWVSRMMMFSYFKLKQIPFKNVFLHGIVKGTDGQKMSKSKKNMIPVDDVVTTYGVDTLRMCYFYQNKAGASYAITYDKLKNFRNFNNKIWNAAKYVLRAVDDVGNRHAYSLQDLNLNILHSEIFSMNANQQMAEKINLLHKEITEDMNKFRFGTATEKIYTQFWHEYCDIYIEESKELLKSDDKEVVKETLSLLLEGIVVYIKLLHPFIPFVTEKVYQVLRENRLTNEESETLMYTDWKI